MVGFSVAQIRAGVDVAQIQAGVDRVQRDDRELRPAGRSRSPDRFVALAGPAADGIVLAQEPVRIPPGDIVAPGGGALGNVDHVEQGQINVGLVVADPVCSGGLDLAVEGEAVHDGLSR